MKAQEFIAEVSTSIGQKYQELYTRHYKQAHLAARKKGLVGADADNYARKSLDHYKDRIRTGAWDPITRTHGPGRKIYSEATQDTPDLMQGFRDFLPIAMDILGLDSLPKFRLRASIPQDEQPTFGRYINAEDTVYMAIEDRNVIDILRTLAHELVHYRQDTECELDSSSGDTGSPEENEANKLAGIIMRHFDKAHPEYFNDEAVDIK